MQYSRHESFAWQVYGMISTAIKESKDSSDLCTAQTGTAPSHFASSDPARFASIDSHLAHSAIKLTARAQFHLNFVSCCHLAEDEGKELLDSLRRDTSAKIAVLEKGR